MTVKYECDRCHRQTTDRDAMLEVTTRTKDGWGETIAVRHYCSFCSLMMVNAISIVNNGTYAGTLKANEKIGNYTKYGKEQDPLFNEEIRKKPIGGDD